MVGEAKLKAMAEYILKASSADETEVVLMASDFGLTRFANSQIHQNVARLSLGTSIRVVVGKKIGVVKTNKRKKTALKSAFDEAVNLAKLQKHDPDFQSLPKVAKYKRVEAYFDSTASFGPKHRAEKIKNIIKQAKSEKLKAFGAFSSGVTEFVVANSHGLLAYFPISDASFSTTIMSGTSSGYGSDLNLDVAKVKIEEESSRAIEKCLLGKKPKVIKPGQYEVVLAPNAVNEMLIYLAYLGFGARAYFEERSFLSGKLGQQVMGKNITLWDDAYDASGIPIPFDLEGVPKKNCESCFRGPVRKGG